MEILVYILILVLTGVIAGFASGMIGVGGCFIMVPVQYWLLSADGLDTTLATRVAFGTGLAVTLPTVMSSAYGHHRRGTVCWQDAIPMGIAAIFGAMTGVSIATWLPGNVLRMFFALVVIFMGIRMVWNIRECAICPSGQSPGVIIFLGLSIGIISGLTGIGGGVVLVPILVILLHYPVHKAIGTSSATLIFSSAGAVMTYLIQGIGVQGLPSFSIGYIDLLQWVILAGTTIPLSIIGVKYAHRCPARTLIIFFAGVMLIVGILMLLSG